MAGGCNTGFAGHAVSRLRIRFGGVSSDAEEDSPDELYVLYEDEGEAFVPALSVEIEVEYELL